MPVFGWHIMLDMGWTGTRTQQIVTLLDMLLTHVMARRWYYLADKLGVLVWQDMPAMYDRACAPARACSGRSALRHAEACVIAAVEGVPRHGACRRPRCMIRVLGRVRRAALNPSALRRAGA